VEGAPERDVEVSPEEREPGRREVRPGEREPRGALPGEREGGPPRTGKPDTERVPGKRDALIDGLLGAFDDEVAKQKAEKEDTEALRTLQKGRDAVIPDQPTAKQKAKETVDYAKKIVEGAKKKWLLFCKTPFRIYLNGTKLKVNEVNSKEINFMANRIEKEKLKELHDQGVRSVDIARFTLTNMS